jgi:GT2 family glycosyltransferase
VTPEISLVIVTWNSGNDLLRCLRSLQENAPAASWEAIVVDNGSTDRSVELAQAEFPWLRVIANRRNRGLAGANNQGIVASKAPFVLLSNPDVLYRSAAIDALLDLLRRRERAAFAVAKLQGPDGELQTSAGDLPRLSEALLGKTLTTQFRGRARSGMWWHGWPHDEEAPIGHGAEACYLVRRDAIAEIGLQDERFVLDWEGVDWSARAWKDGWEVWFCPAAVVTHLGGLSVRQASVRWVISTHRGMYLYFRSRLHPAGRPVLALTITVRSLAKLAAVAAGLGSYELAQRRG